MGINRAQYIQGNDSATVLNNTVQGVIPDETTIKVSSTGVISTNDAAFFRQIDDIASQFNGVNTVFNIRVSGTPFTPVTADNLLISLGGVMQIPGPAFTVSGSTIIFDAAPSSGTSFAGYVVVNGSGGGSGGIPGTVTSVGTGAGLSGGPIVTTGTITLDIATDSSLGGVIVDGTTISVTSAGVISAVMPPTSVPRIVNLGTLEPLNGVNQVFTLCTFGTTNPYTLNIPSNLTVFLGGVPQLPSTAYMVSGNKVTFATPPPSGSTFLAITVQAA